MTGPKGVPKNSSIDKRMGNQVEISTYVSHGLHEVSEEIARNIMNHWVITCVPDPDFLHQNPVCFKGVTQARVVMKAEEVAGVNKIDFELKIRNQDQEAAATRVLERVLESYRCFFKIQYFKVELTGTLTVDPDLE